VWLVPTVILACASPRTGTAPEFKGVRILPLGDSITKGKDGDGYRGALAKLLRARGHDTRFVGSLNHGSWWMTDRAHEGHDGAVIQNLTDQIERWSKVYRPDVVLLMIGANDLETDLDLARMPARYQALLDRLILAWPRAWIVISEITLIRIPAWDQLARDFNPRIQALAAAMAARGARVTFVPMHDVLRVDQLDAVDHPDFFGNERIAERWMDAVGPILDRVKADPGP
jgi:lysophospholipase L1-like esterase